MQIKEQIKKISYSPLFWIIAFAIVASPMAFTYMLHYVDERHYTNAAIQMLANNDYLTPLQQNGEARFLKPILSYWMITASYHFFGISAFSSRLPFYICALALLFVTFKISLRLSGNKNISLTALLVLMTNPLLLLSTSRSIPDIPQALFFGIGALGITGLITSSNAKKRDLWLLHIGFALAFATKGLPALAFGGLSGLFLLVNPWKKYRIKELFHFPAIACALVIALFWYLVMYIIHGNEFIESFFTDQIGGRVTEDHFRIAKNALFAILTIIGYYIIWLIPLFRKEILKNKWFIQLPDSHKAFTTLSFLWLIAMFLLATFTVKFYDRYFLPVFPLISIVLAIILHSISQIKHTTIRINHTITTTAILGLLTLITAAILSYKLDKYIAMIGSIITFLLLLSILFIQYKKDNKMAAFQKLAVTYLLASIAISITISIISLPDQSEQIAQHLKRNYPTKTNIIFFGQDKVAAKIRVSTAGNYFINQQPLSEEQINSSQNPIIFRADMPPTNLLSNNQETIATEWRSFPILELIASDKSATKSISKKHQNRYVIHNKAH